MEPISKSWRNNYTPLAPSTKRLCGDNKLLSLLARRKEESCYLTPRPRTPETSGIPWDRKADNESCPDGLGKKKFVLSHIHRNPSKYRIKTPGRWKPRLPM